jgi:hypothetical protein
MCQGEQPPTHGNARGIGQPVEPFGPTVGNECLQNFNATAHGQQKNQQSPRGMLAAGSSGAQAQQGQASKTQGMVPFVFMAKPNGEVGGGGGQCEGQNHQHDAPEKPSHETMVRLAENGPGVVAQDG